MPKFIFFIVIVLLSLNACDSDLCDDDNNRELFDSFESNLKIDPISFSMASEIDTVGFEVTIGFDGYTNDSEPFRLCSPTEYENYWTSLGNGSFLNLFKKDFQMQLFLYFNEGRSSEFQLRQVNGEYKFFEPFSEIELVGNSLEILPTFIYNGVELKNVVRIQAANSGELLEELIYQRENGILRYRNFSNNYEYGQIGL
ncbi:hypothetical protein [Maribacter sp. IgM3_T14_3]|uniref:hypothetical protein n=1 Tax=Maribacter sp. IgM3_T14_3 TaxID=3415140 RepID=UPI003C6F8BCD